MIIFAYAASHEDLCLAVNRNGAVASGEALETKITYYNIGHAELGSAHHQLGNKATSKPKLLYDKYLLRNWQSLDIELKYVRVFRNIGKFI